jgi:hypothetical protein
MIHPVPFIASDLGTRAGPAPKAGLAQPPRIVVTFLSEPAAKPPQVIYQCDIDVTSQAGKARWLILPATLGRPLADPLPVSVVELTDASGPRTVWFGGDPGFFALRIPDGGTLHVAKWRFSGSADQDHLEAWVADEVQFSDGTTLTGLTDGMMDSHIPPSWYAPAGLEATFPRAERVALSIDRPDADRKGARP